MLVVPPSHNHKNRFLIYNHGFQTCWRNQITGHNKTQMGSQKIYIYKDFYFLKISFHVLIITKFDKIGTQKNITIGRNKIIQKVVYFLFVFFFFFQSWDVAEVEIYQFFNHLIISINLFIFSRVFFPLKNNNICHKWFFFD